MGAQPCRPCVCIAVTCIAVGAQPCRPSHCWQGWCWLGVVAVLLTAVVLTGGGSPRMLPQAECQDSVPSCPADAREVIRSLLK